MKRGHKVTHVCADCQQLKFQVADGMYQNGKPKNITTLRLDEVLSEAELAELKRLMGANATHEQYLAFAEPLMARINLVTGQENDARYIAYVLEYLALKAKDRV